MQGERVYSWVTSAQGIISVLVGRWRDTPGTVPTLRAGDGASHFRFIAFPSVLPQSSTWFRWPSPTACFPASPHFTAVIPALGSTLQFSNSGMSRILLP